MAIFAFSATQLKRTAWFSQPPSTAENFAKSCIERDECHEFGDNLVHADNDEFENLSRFLNGLSPIPQVDCAAFSQAQHKY